MTAPSAVESRIDDHGDLPVRTLGLFVGVAVGGLFALVGAVEPTGLHIPTWPATVVAGGIGGFLVAPTAWRVSTGWGALGIIVALGLLAVVIGDAAVVITNIATPTDASPEQAPLALRLVAAAVLVFALGLVVAGPAILPFTLAGATFWMAGMAIARWLLYPGGRGRGPTA